MLIARAVNFIPAVINMEFFFFFFSLEKFHLLPEAVINITAVLFLFFYLWNDALAKSFATFPPLLPPSAYVKTCISFAVKMNPSI